MTGETGETYVVTDGGTYTVETTKIGDASCKRTASVVIDEVIPDPNVGNDIPLCGGSTLDVDATVSTPNLTYTWTKDGAPFSTGAIASVEDPATYVIAISDPEGHCVTNSTSLVASNSGLSVKHDTACVAGGTVDLKILSTGGPFTWFEQELNGSSVHIGNDYSTTINSDKTYWVQNTGGAISKNVGLSDRGDGTNHGWYATYDAQKYMVFDVYQELTIDSVTVYGDWSENEADVVFSVYDENDALVDTKTAHYTADGGPGVAIRLPVGITVPAGNGYKFKLVGSNVALYYGQKSTTAAEDIVEADDWFAYPFTFDNIMQIKTSYSGGWEDKRTYSGIYNWLISTGQPCPRVPVYGVVDATNCSGPQVSIIEPSDADEFAYNTDVTIKVGAVDDGTVDKVEVTIAGSTYEMTLNGGTYEYVWNTGATSGDVAINVTATDNDGLTGSASVDVKVINNNGDPVLTLTADETIVVEGENVVFTWSATDPENDALTYEVKLNGAMQTGWTSPYTWVSSGVQSHTLEVTVTDGNGGSDTKSVSVDVTANQDPTLTLTADQTSVIEGDDVVFTWSATDPESDPLSFLVKLDGATVTWSSPYTWSTTGVTAGNHVVEVVVNDGNGGTDTKNVSVNVVANQDPVLTLTADETSVIEGDEVVFTWSATDPENETLSTTIKLDNNTVSWTSPYTWTSVGIGSHTVEVTVTDPRGGLVTKTVSVNVVANQDPVISLTSDVTTATTGDNVTFTWSATDPEGESPLTVKIELDGVEQTTWSSPQDWTSTTGDHTITVTATDSRGAVVVKSINVSVTDPANTTPVLTFTCTSTAILTGESVDLEWFATDVEDDDATLSSAIVITLDGTVQTGWSSVKTWTPATAGTYVLVASVTDAGQATTSKSITVTVTDPQNLEPVLTVTATPNSVLVGENVTLNWSATDPENDALTYIVTFDNVDKTNIWNDGEVWVATGGTHELSVTVSDGINSVTESVTITVTDPTNDAPVLVINASSLTGVVGDPITFDWSATDTENDPLTYTVLFDNAPVSWNNPNVWTATVGSHTLSVTVSDGTNTVTESVTVTITSQGTGNNGVITIVSPTDGEVINNPGEITVDIDVTDPSGATVEKVTYQVTDASGASTFYTVDANAGFDLVWLPDVVGNYTVKINPVDNNGKVIANESKTISITLTGTIDLNPTGIAGAVYINEVSIYPSPATSNATVALTARTAGDVTVEVLDMNGNVVFADNGYMSSSDVFEMNFSVENLPSGIYLTRVTLNGETVTKKLVVQ